MNRRRTDTGRYVGRATAKRMLSCRADADWHMLMLRGLAPRPVRVTNLGEVYDRRALLKAREVIYSRMPVAGISQARH